MKICNTKHMLSQRPNFSYDNKRATHRFAAFLRHLSLVAHIALVSQHHSLHIRRSMLWKKRKTWLIWSLLCHGWFELELTIAALLSRRATNITVFTLSLSTQGELCFVFVLGNIILIKLNIAWCIQAVTIPLLYFGSNFWYCRKTSHLWYHTLALYPTK